MNQSNEGTYPLNNPVEMNSEINWQTFIGHKEWNITSGKVELTFGMSRCPRWQRVINKWTVKHLIAAQLYSIGFYMPSEKHEMRLIRVAFHFPLSPALNIPHSHILNITHHCSVSLNGIDKVHDHSSIPDASSMGRSESCGSVPAMDK